MSIITHFPVAVLALVGISACAGQQAEPRSGQSTSCADEIPRARTAVNDLPDRRDTDKADLNLYLWEAQQAADRKDEQTCWKNLGQIQSVVNF
jgi:hypothetical protein